MLHFMMADGGFDVSGSENAQEILNKQLLLCQFATAVAVLRPGGAFVCKLFDAFTPFTAGLIYLMLVLRCSCGEGEQFVMGWTEDTHQGLSRVLGTGCLKKYASANPRRAGRPTLSAILCARGFGRWSQLH
jgi:hypothetical protein